MKQNIEPKELHWRIASGEALRIVDVRLPFEFAGGHLPGAQNIPLHRLDCPLPGVEPGERVVMVCHSGLRSQAACSKVLESHKETLNLAGGTAAWKAAGFALEGDRSVDRQTHLVAGLLVTAALLLARNVNPGWMYLAALPAFGLLLDALTGICPMTLILRKMPWNASQTKRT